MRIAISSLAALAMGFAAIGQVNAEDLSAQVDAVASFVNAEDTDQIGGPADSAGIVAGLDGQWFPLNNIVRNWGASGAGLDAESVNRSVAQHCSGDTDDATFYEATGDDSFSVRETLGRYDTEFTQVLTSTEGRRFSIAFDDDALIRSYGKQDASESEKAEILAMAEQIKQQELEFWRPSEDILISRGPFGLDVTGRCPVQ